MLWLSWYELWTFYDYPMKETDNKSCMIKINFWPVKQSHWKLLEVRKQLFKERTCIEVIQVAKKPENV